MDIKKLLLEAATVVYATNPKLYDELRAAAEAMGEPVAEFWVDSDGGDLPLLALSPAAKWKRGDKLYLAPPAPAVPEIPEGVLEVRLSTKTHTISKQESLYGVRASRACIPSLMARDAWREIDEAAPEPDTDSYTVNARDVKWGEEPDKERCCGDCGVPVHMCDCV